MENAKCVPQTDERIRRTRRRGITISLDYDVEVRDKNGKLVSKCKGKNDAFVKNYIRMLRTMLLCTDALADVKVSLPNTSNVPTDFECNRTAGMTLIQLAGNSGSTVEAFGVRIGTSDTAFGRDQYELIARIVHGTGAGQMLYGATTVEDYTDEDSVTRFRIIRAFTNSSGGAITVKEIGIAICNFVAGAKRYFLIARDVLPSPQVVPDGNTITIRYRLFISYA